MSKSKTIIAGLGVVAALGTAALPLVSYAADAQTVTGNVDLYVEVLPAIAMTITGNNDGNSNYGSGNGAVDVFNPSDAASSSIDGHTTPATATTVASSSYTSLLPNSKVDGNSTNGFRSTVTVYTNAASGYTLAVKDSDSTTALTKVGGTATIPAGTSITAGTAAWAYKAEGDAIKTGADSYAAITAADVVIAEESVKTSNGTITTVSYGVSTASDQETGVYQDTITYTATTK